MEILSEERKTLYRMNNNTLIISSEDSNSLLQIFLEFAPP